MFARHVAQGFRSAAVRELYLKEPREISRETDQPPQVESEESDVNTHPKKAGQQMHF